MRVVGVDGCPDGWFAVVLDEGAFALAFFAESIAEVLRRSAGCAVVAVDIPIGSEPDRFRRVDDAARAFVKPLQSSKGTWAGHSLRRDLLAGVGIHLPGDLGEAGLRAGVDDVVDAAAAAWSAHRHGLRESERLEPVTTDANGREVTIWY